jgi:Na+/proline symporter
MMDQKASWGECLVVGLVGFGALGTAGTLALLAALVAYLRDDTGLWEGLNFDLVACAVAAAAVAGAVAWRVVEAPDATPGRRGARAGLIAGLAAHPLCWLLFGAQGLARGRFPSGSPEQVAATFFVLLWPLAASLGALGWISAPLGAVIGYLAAALTSSTVTGPGAKGRGSHET